MKSFLLFLLTFSVVVNSNPIGDGGANQLKPRLVDDQERDAKISDALLDFYSSEIAPNPTSLLLHLDVSSTHWNQELQNGHPQQRRFKRGLLAAISWSVVVVGALVGSAVSYGINKLDNLLLTKCSYHYDRWGNFVGKSCNRMLQ